MRSKNHGDLMFFSSKLIGLNGIFDSCIELAVARHMCGMLNQNVHRTFWLKHNPVVSPGQVFERVTFVYFLSPVLRTCRFRRATSGR
jgi:hypothetical protein